MEEFIHNVFDIQNINNKNYINSTQFYFKNQKGNEMSFYLKDYINKDNLINIYIKNTENRFLSEDIFYLKYKSDKNIKVFCIDPYSKNIIENNYIEVGRTSVKKNRNYFLIKIITKEDNFLLNVTFNTLDKQNLIVPHNLPLEMKIYFENNQEVENFNDNFSSNFSEILEYSKEKIILIEIEKKLLISISFLILPDKGNITSEICEKILDLFNIKNTINKYEENILKLNSKYAFFVNNIRYIEHIKTYSDKKFIYGLQIKSHNCNIYESNININKINVPNIFKIKNADKYTKIILQLKNKDYDIKYDTDNKETIITENTLIIKSYSCVLNFEIIKNLRNILVPNIYNNIQVKEVNKFKIEFKFYPNESIFEDKKLFSDMEKNKIKIICYSIIFGIFGGIIYSKITSNDNKEETFIPKNEYTNINDNIIRQELNDSKYKKYNLDKDFFDEKIDSKDLEILSKLGMLKKKKIYKNIN